MKGCPCINVDLAGRLRRPFVLDTGANATCIRQESFDVLLEARSILPRTHYRGVAFGGEIRGQSGYVNHLQVGSFNHDNIRLDRCTMSLLGLRYLARFVVRLDFPNNVAYFSPGRQFADPERTATSGLAVFEIGGQKIVRAVEPGSAADAVGIRAGDIIEVIDGRSAATQSLFELGQILTSEVGRRVRVTLRRDTMRFPVVLVLGDSIARD